jgi:signal transduction histidine kinase
MRTRLSVLLLVLMGVVLVSLGVPLGSSIAAGEARSLNADRVADLAIFVSRVPTSASGSAPGSTASSASTSSARALQPGRVEMAASRSDLRRYDEVYGITVSVYDSAEGLLLSSRDREPTGAVAQLVRGAVRTALAGRQTDTPARVLPWRRDPLVAAQPVVRDGDVVGAVVSVSPIGAARARVLHRWLILGGAELVALVGAALLAGRLARWLLRPVARLDEAAHQISAGDLAARVPTGSGPPELRRLEHSFNDMAVHVQEAVEAQRAFLADASHQLRNPLAALLLRLEGLRLVPTATQPEAAERALADGRHLAGTLDRMLALAQVEHNAAASVPVEVAALVDERLASWRVVAQRRSIRIERRGETRIVAQHEPGALAGALDAVLDNSLKYSPEHSQVTVEVRRARGPGDARAGVQVTVTDDGPGVPEADLPRVVDRFWRSDAARSSGTGLGMSIAKTLLERHGGRLEVATTADRGLRVTLHLPGEGAGALPEAMDGEMTDGEMTDDESGGKDRVGPGAVARGQGFVRR